MVSQAGCRLPDVDTKASRATSFCGTYVALEHVALTVSWHISPSTNLLRWKAWTLCEEWRRRRVEARASLSTAAVHSSSSLTPSPTPPSTPSPEQRVHGGCAHAKNCPHILPARTGGSAGRFSIGSTRLVFRYFGRHHHGPKTASYVMGEWVGQSTEGQPLMRFRPPHPSNNSLRTGTVWDQQAGFVAWMMPSDRSELRYPSYNCLPVRATAIISVYRKVGRYVNKRASLRGAQPGGPRTLIRGCQCCCPNEILRT